MSPAHLFEYSPGLLLAKHPVAVPQVLGQLPVLAQLQHLGGGGEDRGQRTEDRGKRTGLRTEDRGQRCEDTIRQIT